MRPTTPNFDQSPPLKVNKDSHAIKKPSACNNSPSSASSSSSTSSSTAAAVKPPQRQHPVIIYTHSPKVIHTHPRDFMALVQKLTGMTRSNDPDPVVRPDKSVDSGKPDSPAEEESQRTGGDDNDSSSVITEENNCGSTEQANSNNNNNCFVSSSSIFDSPAANQNNNPYLTNLPPFPGSSAADQFLCPNNQAAFFNYSDPLFLGTMRSSSISSSASSLDAINDFRDF
ncbi:VQ motif-containing protein 20 [Linum grandiflorum]